MTAAARTASPPKTSAFCIDCGWESRTNDATIGAELHLGMNPAHTVAVVTSQLMHGDGVT